MTKQLLIVFVKNPELGKAKTRLAKTIGDEKALAIYELLLGRTKDIISPLPFDIQIHYSEFIDQNDQWPNDRFDKELQVKSDLGGKMEHAFSLAFKKGYHQVCIIGSDCYDLETGTLSEAFNALDKHGFVIGPSLDGGYYLLGMKKFHRELFQNKQWSTSTVFNDTITDFINSGESYFSLKSISDVDVEADLGEWANDILNQ